MGGAVCHGQLQLVDRIVASPNSTVFVAAEIVRSFDHIRACVFQSVDGGGNTGMHRALILPGQAKRPQAEHHSNNHSGDEFQECFLQSKTGLPYFTKTVTSDWLVLPPIVTTTFCAPAGVSAGNVTLN